MVPWKGFSSAFASYPTHAPQDYGTQISAETMNTSNQSSANLGPDTLIDFAGAGHNCEEKDDNAAFKVASVTNDNTFTNEIVDSDDDDDIDDCSQILLSPRKTLTDKDAADHDQEKTFDKDTIDPNTCLCKVIEDTITFDKYQAAQNTYVKMKKAMIDEETEVVVVKDAKRTR